MRRQPSAVRILCTVFFPFAAVFGADAFVVVRVVFLLAFFQNIFLTVVFSFFLVVFSFMFFLRTKQIFPEHTFLLLNILFSLKISIVLFLIHCQYNLISLY